MNDSLQKTTDPDIWNYIRACTNNTRFCTKKRVETIVWLLDKRSFSLNSSAPFKYRYSKRFVGLKSIGAGGHLLVGFPEPWLSIKAFHAPTSTHLCIHRKRQHTRQPRLQLFQCAPIKDMFSFYTACQSSGELCFHVQISTTQIRSSCPLLASV